MFGAIAGDIIGSVFEWNNIKTTDFPLFSDYSHFTDDTVMTIAVADCLLNNRDIIQTFRDYGRRFPDAGYGEDFYNWLRSRVDKPNISYGIGAAMRISPIGYFYNDIESVLNEAKRYTVISHNHPEAVRGAQTISTIVVLCRMGKTKAEIKDFVEAKFGYNLNETLDKIRAHNKFNENCAVVVPQAIIAFLESTDYEDAVRKAVSLGGDSDTIACITGGIAEAFYGDIGQQITAETKSRLPAEFLAIIEQFNNRVVRIYGSK